MMEEVKETRKEEEKYQRLWRGSGKVREVRDNREEYELR